MPLHRAFKRTESPKVYVVIVVRQRMPNRPGFTWAEKAHIDVTTLPNQLVRRFIYHLNKRKELMERIPELKYPEMYEVHIV